MTVQGRPDANAHPFRRALASIRREKWYYILLVPGLLYYLVFKYLPMWGICFAFQNYSPARGFLGSPWVGLAHFTRFFSSAQFGQLFGNTLVFALLNLAFYFPFPIILALLLNELENRAFKRSVQSIIYLPHFLSWVVVASITQQLLSSEGGMLNELICLLGGDTVPFLTSESWLRPIILLQTMWKEAGWGTIIFLAALTGVDPSLYDAAEVDGAGHWKRMWHITLPCLRSTIVTLLILRMGNFLDTGFEQLFLMTNSMNRSVGDVFDTYVYRNGIVNGQFSYATAVGLFKSVFGLLMVWATNRFAQKIGEEGIL